MTLKTTCAYCGTGCGVLATPGPDGIKIAGDTEHPANFGRLCSKGSALGETLIADGRLLTPEINGRPASWDTALDLVAQRFADTIAEHGPDSVAFYVSGQLLTEDYYVANKLIKGYMGTANIDTNSRLCMASTVAGHKRAFGTDTVPGTYEDLEEADLIVLVGSNLAWCHPVIYQRIVAAKAARPEMKVVNIDPRRTATCDLADLHLQIAPGADVALFNHLLAASADHGLIDQGYVAAHVDGFDAALEAARADDVSVTGLSPEDIAAFVALWAGSEKAVTVFSQGVNQSTSGADKVNAILNCHLATGRIGRPGMGPFSVTGQPNAMGGREVGGLANMLACHLDVENADHRAAVQDFWQAPTLPTVSGLKAVDMFDAVERGEIKAIWVMCTNPAQSMPEADRVRQALIDCPFVVVSEMFPTTETAATADVLLPATGWGEKTGTVTNSDRTISRQRALMPPMGDARHDWQIICDVATRMGWGAAFDFDGPAAIFREHAQLSGVAAALGKDFDISGLAEISDAAYDALAPVRWPVSAGKTGGRFFADGGFFTESGKANMLPLRHRAPATALSEAYPLRLNTGRIRDQWHTQTRTGLSARLNQHMGEPYLEVHPEDALRLGLKPAHLAAISSPNGRAILRVLVSSKVQKGTVFAPLHWTADIAPTGRINALVNANVDPVSGQPESKAMAVHVAPYEATWFGYAVCAHPITAPDATYWAKARTAQGWQYEMAGATLPADWAAYAEALFGITDIEVSQVTGPDPASSRIAFHKDGKVIAALFTAATPVAVSRSFVSDALGGEAPILAGRPGADQPDPGPVVCACFNVGVNTILRAIEDGHLMSVEAIGTALQAGTNCGSCRPELSALLKQTSVRTAAE
ncbi:nitrate reductase [Cognatishimia sp. SS12]|uniref:nitrate reductase n=1 Tax=Cognatishimia sp. SS12 TaxID=2979465 RepID=UPI00232FF6C2|nr:nitrate reductase [Cognatishimia sp. SS12]MDC0738805.1 nitrate reductase [Cognatishimia sp. SS12]